LRDELLVSWLALKISMVFERRFLISVRLYAVAAACLFSLGTVAVAQFPRSQLGVYARTVDLYVALAPRPVDGAQSDRPKPAARRAPYLVLAIDRLVPRGAAERGGLEVGDLVLRANNFRVQTPADLRWVAANSRGKIKLQIMRVGLGSGYVYKTVRF
jgi:S1-C subfamily serine protease